MNRQNLEQLLNATNVLRYIHTECAQSEHARQGKDGGEWQPYIPTNFVYGFFTFNTLYNIDWEESLNSGEVLSFSNGSEVEKWNAYITFCCKDTTFVETYCQHFINFIKHHYDIKEVRDIIDTIERDEDTGNGRLKSYRVIRDFRNACKNILIDGVCNKYILTDIVTLIYKVRCNLFHGIKTLKELNDEKHKEKLKLYSLFLIAINQMVFSYLNYLNEGVVYDALYELKDEKIRRNRNCQLSNK